MTYDEVVKLAFLDELCSIYEAGGIELPELDKIASSERLYYLIKEARFVDALKKMVPRSGTSKFLQAAEREGLGEVAGSALKKQTPLKRLEAWGKAQRSTPAQRLTAARKAATNPTEKAMLTVKGPNKARQMAELQQTSEQIGGTSLGKRMMGASVEGGAAHLRHHPGMAAINPLGVPLGGAIEGATRQVGRELGRAGGQAGSAGLQRAGQLARRHAGAVGMAGEIAGVAGLGTALHTPLSLQGVIGKGLTAPLGAGGYGGHLLSDVVGTKAIKAAPKIMSAARGPV